MKNQTGYEARTLKLRKMVGLMQSYFVYSLIFLILIGSLGACTGEPVVTPESALVEPPQEASAPSIPDEAPGFDTTFDSAPCPMDLPKGAIEGENVLCGLVEVPERHAKPKGQKIRLAVAVIKSESAQAAPDPLVMLAGGPGSSALTVFTPLLFAPQGEELRADRDVVLVEQRGTKYSSPFLYCDENYALNLELMAQNLDADARKPLLQEALNACQTRLTSEGIDLSAYNSLENAADIVTVVRALGYESFNLYGGSYGTMLAQHIMREYPQGLRSVILDSVAPLRHEPNLLYKAQSADRALRLMFSRCSADPSCTSVYPDLEEVFFQTVVELNASPVTLQVTNPYTGTQYALLLTGDKFVQILRDYLYYTALLPSLPELIADVAEGDYNVLAAIQSSLVFQQDLADGMYKSVVCSELVDFTTEDFADPKGLYPPVARVMQGMLGEIWVFTCEVWDVEPLDPSVKTSVESDIPTLLMEGEFDPTVPPAMADVASEAMSQAYIYTFPGIGHGVLGTSECATSIMLDFIADPSLAPDASCIEAMPGLVFDVPGEVPVVVMEPYSNDELGIRGLAPADWTEVRSGLIVRGATGVDQTTLIFDFVLGEAPTVFVPGLQSLFALDSFPESGEAYEGVLTWDLYALEAELSGIPVRAFVALAGGEAGAYVVLLIASPEEADGLYESVFLPAVEALEPME